jgi:hypothetical protein
MRRRPARVGSDNVDAERLPVVIELSGAGVAPLVLERFEQDDVAVALSSGWVEWVESTRSEGSSVFTDRVGATAEFTFAGDAVRLLATLRSHRGVAQVSIDGVDYGTVDLSSAVTMHQTVFFEADGLGAGEHTLTLTNTAQTNSGATRIELDAIEAEGLVATPGNV